VTAPAPLAVLTVAAGGAVGACLRAAVDAVPDLSAGFPWSTLAVNVVGSLLLALLPAVDRVRRSTLLPLLLGPGLLGGFTTMSAWSEETRALVAGGELLTATGYVLVTLAACLAAVAAADRLSSPAERAAFEAEEGDR
jgi:fluoride exporter